MTDQERIVQLEQNMVSLFTAFGALSMAMESLCLMVQAREDLEPVVPLSATMH